MFDLTIEFVGMCLYVPEPTINPVRLHVLMVAPDQAPAMSGHAHEAHHPRVFFDARHVDSAATGFHSVALNDKLLDLQRFTGTNALNTSLPNVPDLTALTGEKVPSIFVGLSPQGLIGARVVLGSGAGTEQKSGPWTMKGFGAAARQITFAVTWTVSGVSAATLDWSLLALNGFGDQRLPALTPLPDGSGGQQVHLRIVNVPHHEIAPTAPSTPDSPPQFGTPSGHYSGHYGIFPNASVQPVPIYVGQGSGGGTGTSFSCMPAQGQLP